MVANISYFDDASNYDELWGYLEKQHIYQLLNRSDSDAATDIVQDLTADQINMLNAALNWATEKVQNGLREKYDLTTVTAVNCPLELKSLIARLAQWMLEKRRLRAGESTSEDMKDLDAELLKFGIESSVHRLNIPKQTGAMTTARNSCRTQFDRAEQFGTIIPEWESDLLPADGYGSDV